MFGSTLKGAGALADKLTADFDGPPEGGRPAQWLLGVVVPSSFAVLGAHAVARHWPMVAGVFCVSLGLLLHVHYFWGLSRRLQPYSDLAKTLAAVPLIGAICYGIVYFLAFR